MYKLQFQGGVRYVVNTNNGTLREIALNYASLKQGVDNFFHFIQWENLVNKQTNWLDVMVLVQWILGIGVVQ